MGHQIKLELTHVDTLWEREREEEEENSNTQQFPLNKLIQNLEKHSTTNLHEWVRVSLGAPFIWPCATYVLRRKQQAGNILVCMNEIKNYLKNNKSFSGPIHFEIFTFFSLWTSKVGDLRWGVGEGAKPFPGLLNFTHDPYLINAVKQCSIKYHFLSLWYDSTWDWTRSPGLLANTPLIKPMVPEFFSHTRSHTHIYIYI